MVITFHILTHSVKVPSSSRSHSHLVLPVVFQYYPVSHGVYPVILVIEWYLAVVLIHISVISEVESRFIYFLVFCMFSSVKCLFKSFAP